MHIKRHDNIITYLGDASHAWSPNDYLAQKELLFTDPYFVELQKNYSLDRFVFLHQQHTAQGYRVDDTLAAFSTIGDYLITNKTHTAIGIMTADCLPVIALDRNAQTIGIAHAGWRGAVANIVPIMLNHMQKEFHNELSNMEIIFGPAARACCYQVDQAFINQLPYAEKTIGLKHQKQDWYFDLIEFITHQVHNLGIKKINADHALCTICNLQFCSYRRQKEQALRQMTLVAQY